jgi:hypothetical protein
MIEGENQGVTSTQTAQRFELAKLDYSRLGTQEQALMDKRPEVWTKFFAILVIPSGYAGIVGLQGAIYLLALVPFFITCIALDVKHDEQVLRYDVRKGMKKLAAEWGTALLDSKYSKQDGARWWHGYYKYGSVLAPLPRSWLKTTPSGLSRRVETKRCQTACTIRRTHHMALREAHRR